MNELMGVKLVLPTQSYVAVGVKVVLPTQGYVAGSLMLVLPTQAACSSSWCDGSAANII
jgi:hypothetical protein